MRIHEHTFENQEVVLDFHEFDHCIFRNCKIKIFGFGSYKLMNNEISGCKFEFCGPAASTIKTMNMLYHGGAKDMIESIISQIRSPS